MQLLKYFLLALLGSSGTASSGDAAVAPSNTTLRSDAIVQPNGGAISTVYPGQNPPKKEDTRRSKYLRKSTRGHGNKGAHRPIKSDTKKDGGKLR